MLILKIISKALYIITLMKTIEISIKDETKYQNIVCDILHNANNGDIIVLGIKLATILQYQGSYTPLSNVTNNNTEDVYMFGSFAGYTVYVDPKIQWCDWNVYFVKNIDEYKTWK